MLKNYFKEFRIILVDCVILIVPFSFSDLNISYCLIGFALGDSRFDFMLTSEIWFDIRTVF